MTIHYKSATRRQKIHTTQNTIHCGTMWGGVGVGDSRELAEHSMMAVPAELFCTRERKEKLPVPHTSTFTNAAEPPH